MDEKYPDYPHLNYNDYEKLDPKKLNDIVCNSKNNYNFYLNHIIFIFQLKQLVMYHMTQRFHQAWLLKKGYLEPRNTMKKKGRIRRKNTKKSKEKVKKRKRIRKSTQQHVNYSFL